MNKCYVYTFLIFSLFLGACNRYYYKPAGINDPLFTKGGQVHAGFSGSSQEDGNDRSYFTDIQLGYSPIDHLGLLGSYSTYAYRPYDKTVVPANAYIAEGAAGAYAAFGGEKTKMIVDLYAGGGGGSLSSDVDMKLRKLFIQPGIGMRSKIFDAVVNLRFSNIKYSDFNANGHDSSYLYEHHLVDTISGKSIDRGSYTFYEPGITIRVGYKFVKAQFQSVFALPISLVSWHYNGLRFTVGLHLNLEDALAMAKKKGKE